MEKKYTIQLASNISGVGVHTIRAWEKRYNAVTPKRNESGRREYSEEEVNRLTLLSDLCHQGHSIGQIASHKTSDLEELLKDLARKEKVKFNEASSQEIESFKGDILTSLNGLLLALKAYKLDIISHELTKLKIGLSPKLFALEVISPLMQAVGRGVVKHEISISQEHALSSIIKFHVGHALYAQTTQWNNREAHFALCSCEGDYHEFGILQAALILLEYKIPFIYLGPNLPAKSLIDTMNSIKCTHAIVGATSVVENKKIGEYLKEILKAVGSKTQVWFGGSGEPPENILSEFNNLRKFDSIPALEVEIKQITL